MPDRLLEEGLSSNANDGKRPILAYALSRGRFASAATLLDHEAEATATDAEGRGAFHWLALAGKAPDPSLSKALLKAGATLALPDTEGKTPLLLALSSGNADTARLFLASGAVISNVDKGGNTPFHMLAVSPLRHRLNKEGRLQSPDPLFALLAENGLDVDVHNADGNTALYLALTGKNLTTALNLVHLGAALTWQDKPDSPALDLFLRHRENHSYLPFLEAGADVNTLTGNGGPWFTFMDTLWHMLQEEIVKKDIETWKQAGVDLDLRDRFGRTALHRLAGRPASGRDQVSAPPDQVVVVMLDGPLIRYTARAVKLINALVAVGADVNALDAEGFTPLERLLMPASRTRHTSDSFQVLTKTLLENGASMRPTDAWLNWGGSKLDAVLAGMLIIPDEIYLLMVRNGLDCNERDENGRDVVLRFIEKGRSGAPGLIRTAAEHGWDPFAKDKAGKDALVYLTRHSNESWYNNARWAVLKARGAYQGAPGR